MESFEYAGFWWLPDNPKKQISGTLKFNFREGITLDLVGSFKEMQDLGKSLEPKIILGFTSNGKKITLYNCYEIHSHMSLPGFLSTSFIASVAFVGHHFEKEESILFNSLSLNYSHLEEWTRITGFQMRMVTDTSDHLVKHEVSYVFPEKVETKVNDIKISFDYNFSDSGDRIKEYKLEQTTFIKIEPPTPLHFNDYLSNICYHLQNFLSLGAGKAIYPLIIKGKNENCKIELEAGRITYNDIDVYYPIKNFLDTSKKLHPLDTFFFFGDIKDNFEAYLNNWFKRSEVIQPVYDLYFATMYSPKMYLQYEFLALTQALEAYHRRVHKGEYITEKDYPGICNILTNAIPITLDEDFKTALKERMKYLNEFSLRKRLKETLDKLGDVVNFLIPNQENFIDDIVNTRNFLTHYDKSLEGKEKKGQELYNLIERMKFVLEICFLIEMGMPGDKIKVLASRNQRYQYLAKQ